MKLSYYQKKADKLFQIWFVKRHPYCEMCGAETSCGHHFFCKASSSALRYCEDNMVAVCVRCHYKFHTKTSAEMNGNLIQKRGFKWWDSLKKSKEKIIKISIGYYKEIIQKYE